MKNPELIQPNLNEFEQYLDQLFNHKFFAENKTRRSVFVAMIAYALEQGMNEELDNFNPIKLVRTIAQETGLKIPEALTTVRETDEWDDAWNEQVVNFDSKVQEKLGRDYNLVVSTYRFNFNSD